MHKILNFTFLIIPLLAGMEISVSHFYVANPVEIKSGFGVIMTTLLTFLYVLFLKRTGANFLYSKIHIPYFIFILYALISLIWSRDLYTSIDLFLEYLSFGLISVLAYNLLSINSKQINSFFYFVFLSQLLIIIVALFQIHKPEYISFINQFAPPSSTFGNRNFFGQYIFLIFPINLIYFFNSKKIKELLFQFLLISLSSYLIFEIDARQIYLVYYLTFILFFIGLLLLKFYFRKAHLLDSWLLKTKYSLTALLFFVTSLVFFNGSIFSSHEANITSSFNSVANENSQSGSGGRLEWWMNSIPMALDNPFGVGLGHWVDEYPLYHKSMVTDFNFDHKSRPVNPHNEIVQVIVDQGWLMIPLLMLFTYYILSSAFKYAKSREFSLIVLGLSVSFISFVLFSLVSKTFSTYASAFLVSSFLGVFSRIIDRKPFQLSLGLISQNILIIVLGIVFLIGFSFNVLHLNARFELGKIWRPGIKGDISKQYEVTLDAYKKNNYDPRLLFEAAWVSQKNSDLENTEKLLNKYLKIKPYDTNALHNLYLIHDFNKDKMKMYDVLNRWYKVDNEDIRALLPLARYEFLNENYDKANKYYSELKKSFDKYKDYATSYDLQHMSIIKFATAVKDYKYVDFMFKEYLKLRPTANNHGVYGVFLLNALGDKKRSKSYISKALELDPNLEVPIEVLKSLDL